MIRRITNTLLATLLVCIVATVANASRLSPELAAQLAQASDATNVGVVIVSFNTTSGLNESHLNILRGVGITKGITLQRLGMVAVAATAGQVKALVSNSSVRSVWSNDRLHYLDNEARTLTGVERTRRDASFTRTNGGLPVSGAGDFSIVINDSGIDATHPDLQFGTKVIQNVQILADEQTNNTLVATPQLNGFTSLQVVENVPDTDLNVGHGTHCAGIAAGTGQQSGGLYAGVAPGAKLIGTGSGAVLFILNALGGFEWSLTNQPIYRIRVISNSWGGGGAFDPDNPINIASKNAHDMNITVIFAAGNEGPGRDTMNPYAKAPWVIGVGAGTKEGGLASFSSRGTAREDRLANSDPNDDNDAPTLVAPGTGREFDSNSTKFTAAILSTRSKSNVFANGLTDDTEIPAAYLPYYTQISGTSMATPFIAGTAALLLDANPVLTPDEIKQILVATASRMPGYQEYQVGAGYVNVHAAVDMVFNNKQYGSAFVPQFNAQFTISDNVAPQPFHMNFNPAALPGDPSNQMKVTVVEGTTVLDILAKADNVAGTHDGDTIGLIAIAPDGHTTYSSGIQIPVLYSRNREIVVMNPQPGQWTLEVRGARGLSTAPQASSPTAGAGTPGSIDGTIRQKLYTLAPIADIVNHTARTQIESVLKNRMMDTFSDGTFRPDANVTREDLARLLFLNTPLRQTLGSTPKFTDVTGDMEAIAEAVTAKGSTLRDYYTSDSSQAPAGMMSATGNAFNPTGIVSRLDIAVALVRALGFDADAKAKAGTNVTVNYSGQTLTLADNADIPPLMRGYVQLALDRGILQAFFTLEQGPFDLQPTLKARVHANDPTTRAFMAYALENYRQHFVAGN
ncbi:MAG TPA: S8 family serine peptidase [Pyrinomonadaceae bacterium]|nr:S8 family serine peptidase [Pyrinomonadaceae bacterium]